ncbi:MAG TPA: TonB-dependent receptor [Myxococcota bacterium]|nr:TonB-dependent receptor [Myxococcota bacterium]
MRRTGENIRWWRRTLMLTLVIGLAFPLTAFAQGEGGEEAPAEEVKPEGVAPAEEAVPEDEAPAEEAKPKAEGVEEIVVTGSRIGRSNLEGFAHITVIDSKEIALSGVNTIDELLNTLPSVTLQGLNAQNNNGGNGWVMVDLRNLGVGRTLVLVNGRRFIKSAAGSAVDLNNIPVQMIDRVEVLLDGASAAYGSDAIGGVINIILKDDFEGFQVDLGGGISGHGDGAELSVSGTGGVASDKGHFSANFNYMHRDEIKQVDRNWAKYPVVAEWYNESGPGSSVGRMYGSGTSLNGRYQYWSASDIDGDGVAGGPGDWADVAMDENGQMAHPFNNAECTVGQPCLDPMGDRYNYGNDQWLIGMMERFSVTALGHYDFTENTKVYMEGTFTNRYSRNQLAPQPIGFGTNLYPNGMVIPTDSPAIPDVIRDDLNTDPTNTEMYGLRRMGGVGNRLYDNDSNTFRIVTGAKGDITDWLSWDVYFNYGKHQLNTTIYNSVNRTKMEETLNTTTCAANGYRGCVDGDYYGATLPWNLRRYISYTDVEVTGWDMYVLAGMLKAELFELPGGPFSVVLGAETRRESGFNRPSSVTQSGDSAGNGLDPTQGSYNAQEVFAEISLPVLKDMPGVHSLTADLAGRFSRYNTFGSEFTYRTGLSYSPIADFMLRGVFSTAFRAPAIGDLYGGVAVSYEALTDPCAMWQASTDPNVQANCAAQGVPNDWTSTGSQLRTNIGGNADLDSETARVFNVGIAVTPSILPKYLKGLSVTFDYYNIKVDNAISGAPPQWILDQCYNSANFSSPQCAFIAGGDPASMRNPSNELGFIDATLQNIATLETSGFDFTVNYGFDFNLLGLKKGQVKFDLGWHGNYMLKYDEEIAGEKVEYAGTITSGSGSWANFRWNLMATFSGELGPGIWSLGNRLRWIDGAKVFGVEWDEIESRWDTPTHHVAAVTYWDVVASYTWKDLTFIFGVDNVLEKDPPFFPEGGQNANIQTYDFIGRYFFTKIGYKF